MLTCDVVVVGAGPAGSSAATSLARAGRDVLVVDKATFPRDKCCGDGLTALALRLTERLGLDPSDIPSWTTVDRAVVSGPRGHAEVFPLPGGPGGHAAVARRSELDAALQMRQVPQSCVGMCDTGVGFRHLIHRQLIQP